MVGIALLRDFEDFTKEWFVLHKPGPCCPDIVVPRHVCQKKQARETQTLKLAKGVENPAENPRKTTESR